MEMVWSKEGLREKRPVLLWLLQGALTLILVIGEFEKGKALGKDALLEFPTKRETRSLERLAGPKEDELRSLVFIFDTTGSMHDDWQGAISGGTRILNEFLAYKKRPVSNFILMPFSDPDFGPAMETENPDTFLNEINKLIIDGGGDCPEMSISAIKEALEAAHPHSYLYVFTDASAKDYNRFEEVLKLVQRKHSEVVFLITGDCEESHSEAFLVYEKIAAASYGQMYYLLKKNVNDVLKSVLITTKPNKSNLLVVSSPELDSTNTAQYNLSVESNLKEMIVEVSGDSPEVDIRNPLGNPPDKINIPFDLPNNKFIVIEYPKPAGNWILKVTFHPEKVDEHSVENPIITVKGIGTAFDVQHGFSVTPAEGLPATAYRPLERTENYIYMEVHPTEDNLENKEKLLKYKWTAVDVMKNNGNPYMSLPLTYIMPDDGEEMFPMKYLAGPFIPPDNLFNLAFRGFDESGNPVTRLTSNFISAEEASAPYVKMASEEEGILDKNLVVKCEVESLIPFSLQWYKNGMPFGGKRDFQQSSDGSLVIPNIKKEDEGKYECEAKNIRGSDRQFTDVTVIALPEINGMEDIQITVPVGKSVMLNCDVVSDLAYDVKWIYKHDGIEEDLSSVTPIRSNIKILGNNSLSLSTLKKSDSGMYTCSASNRAGITVKEVEINILSPPKITTSPDDKFEFIKGESIHINCNVECNSKTKIHWEFNGAEVGPLRERYFNEIIPLTIPSANHDWEGTYTCIAENEAGRVQKEVKGIYVVLPLAKAPNPYVAVKLGQDATLKCSVTGVPPPVIEWTIGDRLIKDGVKHQISSDGSSLLILKSDLHDEGIYKCVASGPRNSKSIAEIKLLLGKPPKPKHLYLNGSVELEKEGSFPCEAEHNAENDLFPGMKTEITWERETGALDFTRQKILKSGALVIKGAKVTDKGMYICTLRNAFGETRMMFNLAVQGAMPPRIEGDYPEERSFKRGETIVLWCNATGRPQPRIIWSFKANDTSIPEELEDGYEEKNSIFVKGGKLILYNVNSYYQGIYSCVAESEAGISPTSKEYNLRLKAPPVLSDDGMPVKATIAEGDSYTFSCTTVGTPKPSFKWIKDNRFAINRNVTGSFSLENDNSILRILSAIPGYHDGTYKCIASNDIGKAVKKFTINVEKARQKNYVI